MEENKLAINYKEFSKLINSNSKENPINIDKYDKQSFIECRLSFTRNHSCWITGTCVNCNKTFTKNMDRSNRITPNFISYCMICNQKITNFEKYGDENYSNREKAKQTNLEKYGCENVFQNKKIKKKIKETNLNKYGVENPSQNDEIKERIKETNLERYGIEHPQKLEEIKEKSKQTNLKKYGVEYTMQSKEVQEKSKKTCLKKYGVEKFVQTKECQEKIRQINKERYGVEHVLQVNEFMEKQQATMIERYGSVNTTYRHTFNSQYFDSSWELAFYIYHKDKGHKIIRNTNIFFKYIGDDKLIHHYYPDFKIGYKYYEIKGDNRIEFYKNGNPKTLIDNKEKYKCMKKHKVILIWSKQIKKYLKYVKDNYPKNFIESCRVSS